MISCGVFLYIHSLLTLGIDVSSGPSTGLTNVSDFVFDLYKRTSVEFKNTKQWEPKNETFVFL